MAVAAILDMNQAKQLSLGLEEEHVTVTEFERQVMETDNVRVIIRADANMKISPYQFERLDDSHTYGQLKARLEGVLNLPFVVATSKRHPTDDTPIAELRVCGS